jgi:NAD(P)-dependent dehydrogenase (short-subunit alcohol dehydrogenase family)
MDNGSHDTVAVVTGSSRGIGKAITREFARKGNDSVCIDIYIVLRLRPTS